MAHFLSVVELAGRMMSEQGRPDRRGVILRQRMVEVTSREASVRARLGIAYCPGESEHSERWFRGVKVLQIGMVVAIPVGYCEDAATANGDAR